MLKCNRDYGDYMTLKPDWFIALAHLGKILVTLKMIPKDNELFSNYIRRLVITSQECPDFVYFFFAPKIDRVSVKLAKRLVKLHDSIGYWFN